MSKQKWDRRNYIPHHEVKDNVLPANPLFTRLLTLASRTKQRPAICDVNTQQEKTYVELLSDVVNLRNVLRGKLRPETREALSNGEEVFISLIAPGGYEFSVGLLAILCLGAAASPLSPNQPVNEACYYVNKARSVAVVTSVSATKLGEALAAEIQRTTDQHFLHIPVAAGLGNPHRPARSLVISSSGYSDPNSASLVIFTSGTTGPPKGAVLPLAAITDGALASAEALQICENFRELHTIPVHHATGVWVSFFPFILSGACIEFKSGPFDPQWTWNRWRAGGITHFSGVPTIYMRMMRYYQEKLSKLPSKELQAYRKGPAQFECALCGTSALPKPIDDFWTAMMDGRRIVQRYGSTEQGVVFHMPFSTDPEIPDGSVGEPSIGIDVKLSEGDEGEVLTRSSTSFSKYLHDPEATKAAFDDEGFFKSGDVGVRNGRWYSIIGRISVDIIKSGGYKISALDIERELLSLPFVDEAMVVGVEDAEFGQRVGAVISVSDSETAQAFFKKHNRARGKVDLDDLRDDLRDRLANYKLPTLLRVIVGELPKSPTNKVVKKVLGPMYFPANYASLAEVQKWDRGKKSRQSKL